MLRDFILTRAEEKLAAIIWREAPLTSPELVAFAEKEINWKKSTTYTVLRKLCDKGLFSNTNANVSVLLTRERLALKQSRAFIDCAFGGSVPKFIASLIGEERPSPEQVAEIRRFINEYESGGASSA